MFRAVNVLSLQEQVDRIPTCRQAQATERLLSSGYPRAPGQCVQAGHPRS